MIDGSKVSLKLNFYAFDFGPYLNTFLELKQFNDEVFRNKSTEVLWSKQQRVVNLAFSVWCRQDKLVCPEEGFKIFVMKCLLLTGSTVGSRPQLDWVSGELNRLETCGENCNNYG